MTSSGQTPPALWSRRQLLTLAQAQPDPPPKKKASNLKDDNDEEEAALGKLGFSRGEGKLLMRGEKSPRQPCCVLCAKAESNQHLWVVQPFRPLPGFWEGTSAH